MKVVVKKKENTVPVVIYTEFIKLQDAMKYANIVYSGGEAKALIQEGQVSVNGEVCTMRGKKLYNGDKFSFMGQTYLITIHS
jgi:ribosome-associated protein